eukprot:1189962-Prorocentrum_minimum.AAC.5
MDGHPPLPHFNNTLTSPILTTQKVSTNGCSLPAIRADDRPSMKGVSFERQWLIIFGPSRISEEGAHSPTAQTDRQKDRQTD